MDIIISLLALFCLCAALTLRAGLHSSLAPLTALGCITLWLTVAGMAGLLLPGYLVCLAVCFGLGLWALLPRKNAPWPAWGRLFSPAASLFWGMTVLLAVYFAIRQPMFHGYDEFSFWGTAAKLTSTNHQLFTTAQIGWPWQASQNPGLILLSYFVQALGRFAQWKVYLAYDMLLFACFAAVLGSLEWKEYTLWVPGAVVCWLSLWFLTVYNRTIEVCEVYLTSYGDIPAGVVFGAAVALWLALRRGGGPRWAVLPVLVLAGNIKGNTFVLALLAAALVAADHWLFPERTGPDGTCLAWKQGLGRRTGFAAACMAAPMALYMIWGRYIGHLASLNAQSGGMGETSKDVFRVAINGTKMLLGLPVPPDYEACRGQFYTAISDLADSFFTSKISMLAVGDDILQKLHMPQGIMDAMGAGVLIVTLILLLLAAAFFWAGKGQLRWRIGAFTGFSLLGFLAYNYMLALSYGFIFKPDQAAALVDYRRYIYCFYLGWFLVALAFFCQAVRQRGPISAAVGRFALLGLACVMLLRVNQLILPQFGVFGFSDAVFADQHIQQARADAVAAAVPPNSRIFLVSQGDNGLDWFEYSLDLLPLILDYSGNMEQGGGGGTFGIEALRPGPEDPIRSTYYHPYTPQQFQQAVQESGCRYLFVDKVDEIFEESYAHLFTDGLHAALSGETLLYQVEADGRFSPVKMEVPA